MQKDICKVCGHVYDPAVGEPEMGIEPGIPFETLPDDWTCPQCGSPKTEYETENAPMPGIVIPAGE